jgi:hypothetical protein
VLDFAFWRCAWRTIRRGREQGGYWRWVWRYRRESLPGVMQAVTANAPHARVFVLRSPGMTRRFLAEVQRTVGKDAAPRRGDPAWGQAHHPFGERRA